MLISIIGSNGLLSSEVGIYCNKNKYSVNTFGLNEPQSHQTNKYYKTDLLNESLDFEELVKSDLIVYASGAGIQSNLNESYSDIYLLNTFVPINITKELSKRSFCGNFVTFGSYFEIGNNNNSVKFTELDLISSNLNVPNDYCISKRLLTRFVVSQNSSFSHIHLILPTIYGEREGQHRIIPYTVNKIKKKELAEFTNGDQIRQYLYVGDVPGIIFSLVENNFSGVVNVPGVETFSVKEIVKNIFEEFNEVCDDNYFGTAIRPDLGMKNLQLSDDLIRKILKDFRYTKFKEAINKYL